jgi:RnfABCDGE-type electron transport complex G subunit
MNFIILRLTVIAFLCALALGLTHSSTKALITVNKDQYALRQLQDLIGNSQAEVREISDQYFEVTFNDALVGHIFEIQTLAGYNGEIIMWLAISTDNRVMGVRVSKHNETPGLGDDLDIDVSDWILSFNKHNLQSVHWDVKKDGGDFDQFTGATITPRAVVAAVKEGLAAYNTDPKRQSGNTKSYTKGNRDE